MGVTLVGVDKSVSDNDCCDDAVDMPPNFSIWLDRRGGIARGGRGSLDDPAGL